MDEEFNRERDALEDGWRDGRKMWVKLSRGFEGLNVDNGGDGRCVCVGRSSPISTSSTERTAFL